MAINYDPDGYADVSSEAKKMAVASGLMPVNVLCNEPEARVGDHTGVTFVAFVNALPRIGERIELQDGTRCEVYGVLHKVVKDTESDFITLMPNVLARRISPER